MPAESPYQIETSAYQIALPMPVEELRNAARAVLTAESIAAAELSLAVVNGQQMRVLNRRHLDHDYDTDVLSFLLETSESPHGRKIEGEIIVSIDMAKAQSADYGTTLQHELTLYIVHGVLHLCGYDDLTDDERTVMRRREQEVMAAIKMGNKCQGQSE